MTQNRNLLTMYPAIKGYKLQCKLIFMCAGLSALSFRFFSMARAEWNVIHSCNDIGKCQPNVTSDPLISDFCYSGKFDIAIAIAWWSHIWTLNNINLSTLSCSSRIEGLAMFFNGDSAFCVNGLSQDTTAITLVSPQ